MLKCIELLDVLGKSLITCMPLIAAYILYLLGKEAYFSQKEYELITKRYLNEGLDAIINNCEMALDIFNFNWERSLKLTKSFLNLGKDTPKELYTADYKELNIALSESWRNYRLNYLVGDNIFYNLQQLLFAFVANKNSFFRDDICSFVRIHNEGGKEYTIDSMSESKRKDIVNNFRTELKKIHEESQIYYETLFLLNRISTELQKQRFNFRELEDFKNIAAVQESIAKANEIYNKEKEQSSFRDRTIHD